MSEWLKSLPRAVEVDRALEIVGALADRVAQVRGCPSPAALPSERHALADEAPDDQLRPDVLGLVWERLMAADDRRRRGAHFTPSGTAGRICELAFERGLDEVGSVWDPAVGGGAFLLAAARVLKERTGLDRAEIVSRLNGTDIDPISLLVADATLELWSACGARANLVEADSLRQPGKECFDLVIGNPPFLSQLSSDTARSSERRQALDERFDGRSGYADEAGLFLIEAVRRTRPGGVVGLVLPQSIFGAVAARVVREEVSESADLAALWVEREQTFDAGVEVVASIVVKRQATPMTDLYHGADGPTVVPTPPPTSWAPLLGAALGVPSVHECKVDDDLVLGDLAIVTAGFRQHFYGIADAVLEEDPDGRARPMLMTAGAIEPLQVAWGRRHVKFAGTRWRNPVVDLELVDDPDVAKWFRARQCPKVLVATQTRVVEVVADPAGSFVPSVPVISVEPANALDVWPIAALLTAPMVAAFFASLAAGTGLSRTAVRLRAASLAAVPLPQDTDAWQRASEAAEFAQIAAASSEWDAYRSSLLAVGQEMSTAYGTDETVYDWWVDRLRFPTA